MGHGSSASAVAGGCPPRGDHASPQGRSLHGLLPLSRHTAPITTIADRVGDVALFVFPDESAWCRANLEFGQPTTFVDGDAATRDIHDMRPVAACRHAVVADSSFGWWAAWLDQAPGGLICALARWFVDENDCIDGRLPPDWMRI
jgi:hypothetical protein